MHSFHATVISDQIFMNFSPKCRTKKLGIIYTILGIFCSFLNREGAWKNHWIVYSISKQCRTWPEAAFCNIWSDLYCLLMSNKMDAKWNNLIQDWAKKKYVLFRLPKFWSWKRIAEQNDFVKLQCIFFQLEKSEKKCILKWPSIFLCISPWYWK